MLTTEIIIICSTIIIILLCLLYKFTPNILWKFPSIETSPYSKCHPHEYTFIIRLIIGIMIILSIIIFIYYIYLLYLFMQ